MTFNDLLPYVGAGGGAAIPLLFWRLGYLEAEIKKEKEKTSQQDKSINLIYFWLAKNDTNFGSFMNKHRPHT